MGTIIPQMGAIAQQDINNQPDVAIGERVGFLATRKGVIHVSPFLELGIFQDNAPNAQQARFTDELDSPRELFIGSVGYLFNGSTLDRFRGDTNGLQIMGPAASDAPELGNPLQMGASVDNTSPAAAAEGDVRRIRCSPQGVLLATPLTSSNVVDGESARRSQDQAGNSVILGASISGLAPDGSFDRLRTLGDVALEGLGQLCVSTAVQGAGVVQGTRLVLVAPATTRVTIFTPAAGNRVRIIAVGLVSMSLTGNNFELYFGAGANIGTDVTKAIANPYLDRVDQPNYTQSFPDGGGPVGAVDDVVSLRTTVDIGNEGVVVILLREE